MTKIKSSEITPEHIYLSRRKFMVGIGALAAGSAVLTACGAQSAGSVPGGSSNMEIDPEGDIKVNASEDEFGNLITLHQSVINYNNYYEFTETKEDVAGMSKDFKTTPWTVDVGGLVSNPKTYDIDDLRAKFVQQERVYRLRCVEGWSMVIPWVGFSLSEILKEVEPAAEAKYVRFETVYRPDEMPGQKGGWYDWPYVEGLRLDEAMHDLTLAATGLYGQYLLPQNGAPFRLVVPWKYGFKSIKSIVRIDLVEDQPTSLWMASAPREYGFYANVNPEVEHPRWSQATERRIGEFGRRKTLPFNGYAEQVAQLYEGLDLKVFY